MPLFLREQPAIIQADRTHSLKNRSDVTSGYNVFVWLGQYQDIYIYTPEIFKGFMWSDSYWHFSERMRMIQNQHYTQYTGELTGFQVMIKGLISGSI